MSKTKQHWFESLLKNRLAENRGIEKLSENCPDENTVSAYLEKALPPALCQTFETHASQCKRCQQELALVLRSAEEASKAPVHQPLSTTPWSSRLMRRWAVIPTWSWGLKPALAVLSVAVVSTFVGYELYLQRNSYQLSEGQVNLETAPGGKTNPPLPPSNLPARENKTGLRFNKPENSSGGVPSQTLSAAPPSTDSNRRENEAAASSVGQLSDSLAKSGKEAGMVVKDAPSSAEMTPQTGEIRDGREKDEVTAGSVAQRAQSSGSSPSHPNAPPPSAALKAASSTGHDESAEYRLNSLAKKPLEGVPTSRQDQESSRLEEKQSTESGERKPSAQDNESQSGQKLKRQAVNLLAADFKARRVEAGDKVFVLLGDTWTDTSIDPGMKDERPLIIHRDSPDYDKQISPFRNYQRVLTEKEDCLIRYQGKIYRITGPLKNPADSMNHVR